MRLICIAILAIIFPHNNLEAQKLKQARIRTSDKIDYRGYTYSGKSWLKGTILKVTDEHLTLRMDLGIDPVEIRLSSITELEMRASTFEDWKVVVAQYSDADELRRALGFQSQTTSPIPEGIPAIKVAYVEESGVEVLKLHPDLRATIRNPRRKQLGLFNQIENFESAQYIRNTDGTYSVRLVTFDENGITNTSVRPVSEAGLHSLQRRIADVIGGVGYPYQGNTQPNTTESEEYSVTQENVTSNSEKNRARFYLGVGLRWTRLSRNDGLIQQLTGPNGESFTGLGWVLGWDDGQEGLGFGFSARGYELKKGLVNERGDFLGIAWSVKTISPFFTYRWRINSSELGKFPMFVGVLGGPTIGFTEVTANDTEDSRSENYKDYGVTVGGFWETRLIEGKVGIVVQPTMTILSTDLGGDGGEYNIGDTSLSTYLQWHF